MISFFELLESIAEHHDERSAEYATPGDPMQNFYDGGRLQGETPAEYAIGLVTKQWLGLLESRRKGTLGTARDVEHLKDSAIYSLIIIILLEKAQEV